MKHANSLTNKTIRINDLEFRVQRIFPKHGYVSYEIQAVKGAKDNFFMILTDYSNFRIIQKTIISEEILRIEHILSHALLNIDSEQTDYQFE
jgi:hypothetical protein